MKRIPSQCQQRSSYHNCLKTGLWMILYSMCFYMYCMYIVHVISDHRLRIAQIKSHTFFKTDQWNWDNIHTCVSPVPPELSSETDTQYFDEIEDSTPQSQSFAAPAVS